jgi:hypothetical protein
MEIYLTISHGSKRVIYKDIYFISSSPLAATGFFSILILSVKTGDSPTLSTKRQDYEHDLG